MTDHDDEMRAYRERIGERRAGRSGEGRREADKRKRRTNGADVLMLAALATVAAYVAGMLWEGK